MAKNDPKSVIEILRKELGLHQGEFAERVGLSRRTVQNIEYGKATLSRKIAWAICRQFNVSQDWLMANDPTQPMVTDGGKPWTLKDREKLHQFLDAVDPAFAKALFEHFTEKVITPLLEDYLRSRTLLLIATLIDSKAIVRWQTIQKKAWSEFLKENPAIAEALSRERISEGLSRGDLESIKEDVEWLSAGFAWKGNSQASGSKK
jgi:transcriptional regulator with XRE-family HTH domain